MKKFNCDHCGKKDCQDCVKDGVKTFCCDHCCDDYKTRQNEPKKEPVNVCKFC